VQHVLHSPGELREWPDADRRSRIVLITRGISAAALETSFRVTVAS
jgi:cobalamin synthesis protein cobW-like protein